MNMIEPAITQVVQEETQIAPTLSSEQTVVLREMIAAGVAVGRKKSYANPKMDGYVFTYSRGIAVFDIEQTLALIDVAAIFLKGCKDEKRPVLVVGSQPAAQDFVQKFAEKHGFMYIVNRWLGGTLTNFKTISQRIEYFKKLKADKASGALDKYTKKENVVFDRTIANLAVSFIGMEDMLSLPAALFVVDAKAHDIAIREACRTGVPIVAIINNDNDPRGIAYPIPANDNARLSLSWIFTRLDEKMQ